MDGGGNFEKEEAYGRPFQHAFPCSWNRLHFLRDHYTERISLDQICKSVALSKSSLLRAFTKAKGVTHYRYLEAVRVNEAKKLLEQGASSAEAAMETGFSDQSHFTNFFNRFIGLTPGLYRDIYVRKGKSTNRHGKQTSCRTSISAPYYTHLGRHLYFHKNTFEGFYTH